VILFIVPFCSHAGKPNFPQVFEKNGGDDGTRTRGLCRDSAAGIGFTTTYKTRGDCQTQRKSYKTYQIVGWVVGWKFAGKVPGGRCFLWAMT
jgi:hypothetical protein